MRIKPIFLTGWMIILSLLINPGGAFCELESLNDDALSTVKAEGVPIDDVDNPSETDKKGGILSVTAGDADSVDLNDPDNPARVLRPPAMNNDPIGNQFNSLSQVPHCSGGNSGCR